MTTLSSGRAASESRSDWPDGEPVGAVLAGGLDAMFWRPVRLGCTSAWYGHVPFAQWLVASTRPACIVELGTHAGVSYAAFCEAVQRAGLDTSCIAVDTWIGDPHAGYYGEEIYRDLAAFHDARYGGFSRLLRMTFDAALEHVADASVDLLHIDGRHRYEDVRHDFDSWQPKLSSRAVVLLHDTREYAREFGVHRLFREEGGRYPHFEFLHEHGLGVLCLGADAPQAARALCAIAASGDVARVRERFASLGERWMLDRTERRQELALATQEGHVAELEAKFAELAAYLEAVRGPERPPERAELRAAMARSFAAEQGARRDAIAIAGLRAELEEAHRRLAAASGLSHPAAAAAHVSRTRRLARRLRRAARSLRQASTPAAALRAAAAPTPLEAAPIVPASAQAFAQVSAEASAAAMDGGPPRIGRVLFAAGEPNTPGEAYRCERQMQAARDAGWDARCKPSEELNPEDLRGVDLLVLWRVTWSHHVEGVIEHVRMFGGRVALDLDDLMIRIDLARVEYIDAIRSINWSEAHVRGMFAAVMNVLHNVDFAIATTDELAAEMRRWQKAAYVLQNCYDAETARRARAAARARAAQAGDGLVRIGYATGSRTHQRDFAEAADGVAATLRARPDTRLVLFRSTDDNQPLLALDEFPALAALADRIEWRDLVPLDALPDELARFDINIVPLQLDNPFVEAKSELKFFEAALAGVPSVASPTGPYRRAIVDGETGILARSAAEWEEALLRLVDDAELRQRMACGARAAVLWRHGPEGNAARMRRFLAQQGGRAAAPDGAALAEAFALDVAAAREPAPMAKLTFADTLFMHDAQGEAKVTIVIASYNYADYILQALESARLQTLEPLDVVVVDDHSTDPATVHQILDWAHTHAERFNRLAVLRHRVNAGLGATRNTGFAHAETAYVLPLDADNRLLCDGAERLLRRLGPGGDAEDAAFAYGKLRHFGADDRITGGERYEPQRLVGGNYIDAMALLARWAWSAAGGYYVRRDAMGWEDYSLWCRLAELGLWGAAVDEVVAEYRVHGQSMVNAITETADNKRPMVELVEQRHPWLRLVAREPFART